MTTPKRGGFRRAPRRGLWCWWPWFNSTWNQAGLHLHVCPSSLDIVYIPEPSSDLDLLSSRSILYSRSSSVSLIFVLQIHCVTIWRSCLSDTPSHALHCTLEVLKASCEHDLSSRSLQLSVLPFFWRVLFSISLNRGLICVKRTRFLYLGIITTWNVHSHRTWLCDSIDKKITDKM